MDKVGLIFHVPARFDLLDAQDVVRDSIRATDGFNLAELRLGTAGLDRSEMIRRGDALRVIGHENDIAVVIDDQPSIAQEIGLDGVHLNQPSAKTLREVHKTLGSDAIIGVSVGASRHDGMSLGEIGTDYVAFGPLTDRGLDEEVAELNIFPWWAELIELPLVAEGGITATALDAVKDYIDFVSLGDEVFGADDPIATLNGFLSQLR